MVTVTTTEWAGRDDPSKAARLAAVLLDTVSSVRADQTPVPSPPASDTEVLDDLAGGES